MQFSVPTNWQSDLIPGLVWDEVSELYGKLAVDFVGGGRATAILDPVSLKKAFSHIDCAHKKGVKFNYLLNATCLGNRELTKSGQKQIAKLVDWLVKAGADSVTVSTPFMLRFIKKNFSFLKVNISVQENINSVRQAKMWYELGADKITLSVLDVNRNFSLLKQIRAAVKCQLQLIANLKCLLGCPSYKYHANINSHASQSKHMLKGYLIDYCTLKCNFIRISQPVEYIKSLWIRPEDVHHYEKIGIDSLKFVGRQMQTGSIHNIVKAYSKREYDGNLLDLLSSPRKSITIGGKKIFSYFNKFKYFFRPQYVSLFRIQKARNLFPQEKIFIDNRLLDGFLEYFLENRCDFTCKPSCNYCYTIAEKVIKIDPAYQEKFKERLENFLNDLYTGQAFYYF
ncbi:MAG: U32 family peptidase [Candidatus Omnitrophota bacterium]